MDKLHYVAKGLLIYETLDADQFIQAFNEELSLDEKDAFIRREPVFTKVEEDSEELLQDKKEIEEIKREFKLPEDEN